MSANASPVVLKYPADYEKSPILEKDHHGYFYKTVKLDLLTGNNTELIFSLSAENFYCSDPDAWIYYLGPNFGPYQF